ncbi:hypothetical protein BF49_5614 [Bradyrhizobium sp.]|uniref:hypothetical protein n=1 Tax=Bradyrhizobium sp. TaxID=376 RepID=UPI0007C1DEFA|nr:hypothetical protein [Bradyrhizobium sp.]CUT14534.1 hypothetical protein BF49_5614 [Bradyrhizobium sp.]
MLMRTTTTHQQPLRGATGGNRPWTEADRRQLTEFYLATPRQNISLLVAKTGRSTQALQTEAYKMGLTVPGTSLRRCLVGQHMFASWGIGNRICPRCADNVVKEIA